MNNKEFEQFVLDNGKEILRFCRMTCADREDGDELYQDTMLKLLSKMRSLDYCKIPTGWPPRPGRKKPLVVPEEKTIASGFRFYVAAISAL